MIDYKHKYIFVHIPRTAGTSIGSFFNIKGGKTKHYNALDIYNQIGEEIWNSYFKFTFVRNPWDRIVSMWNQPAYGDRNPIGKSAGKSLKYFLERYTPFPWEHGITFHDYLNYGKMDFVGRFESRNQDLKHISEVIGTNIDPNIHKRKTSHKPYWEYYDDETRGIVAEVYKKDIEYFGYEFGE